MNTPLRILIVCSGNNINISPIIKDQVSALQKQSIECEYFLIKGKGLIGYFKNFPHLKNRIKLTSPDIIHAHYGLSGLLAVLQRKIPVIITFHGSDINLIFTRFISRIAAKLAKANIFVEDSIAKKARIKKYIIIPCGVDLDIFYPREKKESRKILGLDPYKKYILFSSSLSRKVKNFPLAKNAVDKLDNKEVELLELKGYSRTEVSLLMNAVDVALMTSISEGSPQFIKEAMACNCPIISTDVGDVKELISETEGCYISSFEINDITNKIDLALSFGKRTNGRFKILHLENNKIALSIISQYKNILNTVNISAVSDDYKRH